MCILSVPDQEYLELLMDEGGYHSKTTMSNNNNINAQNNVSPVQENADDFVNWIIYTFDLATESNSSAQVQQHGKPRSSSDPGARPESLFSEHELQLNGRFQSQSMSWPSPPDWTSMSGVKRSPTGELDWPRSAKTFRPANREESLQLDLDDLAPPKGLDRTVEHDNQMVDSPMSVEGEGGDHGKNARWKPSEIALLLHIAKNYIEEDVKVIGDISRFCGIKRAPRAIDKQLKRQLMYDRWSNRNVGQLRHKITQLLGSGAFGALKSEDAARLESAKQLWRPNL